MNLFHREFGEGPPLIILHGLMGSSDNWITLGKQFSEHFHVFLIDQRNHGQSFHSDEFNYQVLTEDLANFVEQQSFDKVSLIGHSMGGKVVMLYALNYPGKVTKLLVADMAPKNYQVNYDLIFSGLNAVDLVNLKSRSEAEKIVSEYIDDFETRQFLLKNLMRDNKSYRWKANLPVIQENIQKMGFWADTNARFDGPTLFISGMLSGYVKDGDGEGIKQLFPDVRMISLESGHWPHAEKPIEFKEAAFDFLKG